MIRASEQWSMTADQAVQRSGYAARSGLALVSAIKGYAFDMMKTRVYGEGAIPVDPVGERKE